MRIKNLRRSVRSDLKKTTSSATFCPTGAWWLIHSKSRNVNLRPYKRRGTFQKNNVANWTNLIIVNFHNMQLNSLWRLLFYQALKMTGVSAISLNFLWNLFTENPTLHMIGTKGLSLPIRYFESHFKFYFVLGKTKTLLALISE